MQNHDRRPSDELASEPSVVESPKAEDRTRRGFLRSTASVSGLILGGAAVAQAASPKKSTRSRGGVTSERHVKPPTINPAHAFELYPGQNARNFREIMKDEDTHVSAVIQAITGLGGTPRPRPTFQNLAQTSLYNFYFASFVFENTGVGAYQAAAPLLSSPAVLATAASIAFVEALHSGFLNNLLNQPLVPGASSFSQPLPVSEIVHRASPYIASLNGGPDPATEISTTPSAQNDIAILNFALLLEYLERDFYDLNVPVFFNGIS